MAKHDFSQSIPKKIQSMASHWLLLGVVALAIAGLYSLVPMLLRSPNMAQYLPVDFFDTALVLHVDLSVLVWLLSITCLLWSLLIQSNYQKVSLGLAALGVVLITAAGFMDEPNPLKNNYVPVLQHPLFMLGLSSFFCAILLQMGMVFYQVMHQKRPFSWLVSGIISAAIITFSAMLAFLWSYDQLLLNLAQDDPAYFYELLFWGGGHILQFTFVQVMIICWLWMVDGLDFSLAFSTKWLTALLGLNMFLAVSILSVYSLYDVMDAEHVALFTTHMQYVGGVVPGIIGLLIAYALITQAKKITMPAHGALIMSLLLFAYGGILGIMISGNNVSIPAHYHGSIIGISLAFMGFAYHILPALGYKAASSHWAYYQPFILGVGQILHITGLVVMGGYGALRKTSGVEQTVETQLGLGLFMAGGILAVFGGLIFVIVMLLAMRKRA